MKSQFKEFNDGKVKIYIEDESGILRHSGIPEMRFGEENVSYKRHYAAKAADAEITCLIHVPIIVSEIPVNTYAVIGDEQYHVEKIDTYKDDKPPIYKLTLCRLKKHRRKEFYGDNQD